MMAQYPKHDEIAEMLAGLSNGDQAKLFSRVSPDVHWEIIGSTPLSGNYKNLEDWKKGALQPINKVLKDDLQLEVVNIVSGGEWATVELKADAVCKNGMEYHQKYAWVMRFDTEGIIVQVRAYLDTALILEALDSNS